MTGFGLKFPPEALGLWNKGQVGAGCRAGGFGLLAFPQHTPTPVSFWERLQAVAAMGIEEALAGQKCRSYGVSDETHHLI